MNARLVPSSSGILLIAALVACSGAAHTELEDVVGGSSSPTDPAGEGTGSADPKADPGSTPPSNKGPACKANPGAFDVPGNNIDDDCNGSIDDVAACDTSLALASGDALDAAKALGLCQSATGDAWGVVSAKWIRPDGVALPKEASDGYGLLPKLGVVMPPSGKTMLAISSGAARGPNDPGFVDGGGNGRDRNYSFPAPAAAKGSSLCPDVTPMAPHDGVALELQIRVPSNARSLSFNHQYFTSDYDDDVCSGYDDFFLVTMEPKPVDRLDGNLTVDAKGDPISVNSPFIRACAAGTHNGLVFSCPLGSAGLQGTGFEGRAATGWLQTTVGVTPSSLVTLRFMIWDSGDGTFDSTALIDGLTFSPSPANETTTIAK